MRTIQDFRCYTTGQLLKVLAIEIILFFLAFILAYITNSDLFYLADGYDSTVLFIAVFYSVLLSCCLYLLGLYKKYMNLYLQEQYLRAFGAVLLNFVILSNLSYWMSDFDTGKETWLASLSISYVFLLITRSMLFVFTKNNSSKTRAIVLGASNKALQLKNNLERVTDTQTDILGYVYKPGERDRLSRDSIIDISITNNKKNELLQYCLENNIASIIVAVDDRRNNFPLSYLLDCKQHGITVLELMEFYEHEFGREQLNILDPAWIIYSSKLHASRQKELNKIASDRILATLLFIMFLPCTALIFIILKFFTGFKNKVIISNKKIGRFNTKYNHHEFNCYNKYGNLSLLGKVILKLRLNNLPSLINIIKGDLSFVGPQPIDEGIDALFGRHFWYYKQRYGVKPGLFSWGYEQIDYDLIDSDIDKVNYAEYQLQYDLFYCKKHNALLDYLIILNKIFVFGSIDKFDKSILVKGHDKESNAISV